MGRFLADVNAGPRIDVHAAFRGKQVGKMHGAVGTPRPERVCPFLAAASAAGVKLPSTHVEASARALEQLRQTQTVNSKLLHYIFWCWAIALLPQHWQTAYTSFSASLKARTQAKRHIGSVHLGIGCRGRLAQEILSFEWAEVMHAAGDSGFGFIP
jgi:hypothetical protein